MSDEARHSVAYSCFACQFLFDEDKLPPRRLKLHLARPTKPEHGDVIDVFLCPRCAEQYRSQGQVSRRLSERTVTTVGAA